MFQRYSYLPTHSYPCCVAHSEDLSLCSDASYLSVLDNLSDADDDEDLLEKFALQVNMRTSKEERGDRDTTGTNPFQYSEIDSGASTEEEQSGELGEKRSGEGEEAGRERERDPMENLFCASPTSSAGSLSLSAQDG